MKEYFRFLLNIDKCLNMAYYDMFFYKLSAEGFFFRNDVEILEDSCEDSLHNGLLNVQMYMNKFPFQIKDYQIVAAMRMEYQSKSRDWKDTLLYRLLWIYHELRKERIYIGSGERLETAESHVLSVIVLYESDFSTRTQDPRPYIRDGGLENHLRLMLKNEFGISGEDAENGNLQHLIQDAAGKRHKEDEPALWDMISGFLSDEEEKKDFAYFLTYVREQFKDFHIEEKLIDRNNRKNEIITTLRLVEFLSPCHETQKKIDSQNMNLLEYCINLWKVVWEDDELEKRYAFMLFNYREHLEYCLANYPKDSTGQQGINSTLPDMENIFPYNNGEPKRKISCSDAEFKGFQTAPAGRKNRPKESDLGAILHEFRSRIHRDSGETLLKNWEKASRQIRYEIDHLEQMLKLYSEDLSREFINQTDHRRREQSFDKGSFAVAEEDISREEIKAKSIQQDCYEVLRQPQMLPSIRFQDELNLRSKVDRCDANLRYYMACLAKLRFMPFIMLIILVTGVMAVHYVLLQPYAVTSTASLAVYVIYICASAALMFLAIRMPGRFFRKRMRRIVDELAEAMTVYIAGYYDRGYNFFVYMNTMNDLDIVTEYMAMLQRIRTQTEAFNTKIRWHREQLQRHLQKINANSFSGLIREPDTDSPYNNPRFDIRLDDWSTDCERSRMYWPQN